jgi:hypothetical protein
MSADHKAFDLRLNNGGYGEKVDVNTSFSGDEFTLRLGGVLTEVKYKIPPNLTTGWDLVMQSSKEIKTVLEPIFHAHGMKTYEKAQQSFEKRLYKDPPTNVDLKKELANELGELIDHFETLVKSHLLEFATKYVKYEIDYRKSIVQDARDQVAHIVKDPSEFKTEEEPEDAST